MVNFNRKRNILHSKLKPSSILSSNANALSKLLTKTACSGSIAN